MTITSSSNLTAPVALPIEVSLVSPVCLSTGVPTGNLTETLDYIPGSSVRGMLAQHYIEQVGSVDDAFHQLFLSGEVTYGNLYFSHRAETSAPSPLSAWSCKHESGFTADEDSHGVVDLLLQSFFWRQGVINSISINQPVSECRVCTAPLERFTSFYTHINGIRETVPTASLRRILTRSAADDTTQTVENGLLYSLEVLDPSAMRYLPALGAINCTTNPSFDLVHKYLLGFFQSQQTFFVGTARSRGLGEIVTAGRSVSPLDYTANSSLIAKRFLRLQDTIQQASVEDHRMYFSITLHSDAIIRDEFFRYKPIIAPSDIAREIDVNPQRIKLELCFSEVQSLSGWNTALRAPKTDALAVRMGSVFLYSANGLSEQELLEILVTLEARGVGDRRTEGFGRLKICDPFHLDLAKEQL